MAKSTAIMDAIAQLRGRLGLAAFDVLDYWLDEPDTIGIARPGVEDPCVCISTAGKEEGRFDVEHGGKSYSDCLIEGLAWVVRQELRQRAKPDAAPD